MYSIPFMCLFLCFFCVYATFAVNKYSNLLTVKYVHVEFSFSS